ncbi:PAS domain-containing protein [Paenarthrobacter sp. YJN-5]|uniref:PAS domain-containing protein n=1 Tax=Paenarthrobacter sp. YJN-5 TaxID=2735316 RepID=UPI00187831CB|nr:PAS domain-containing protein [Paenarthrobacter sp. YJN-5]QOT16818.1 PAS domain-containing protein [Paenarthrobacter sp. YJN-5]
MTDANNHADSWDEPDFRQMFESLPNQFIVVDPQRRVLAATDSFLAATGKHRDAILGRDILLVFPDNPEDPAANGTTVLRESIERVLATRETDILPIQRYDIELSDGSYEERYWQPLNAPVFDTDGTITCILHGAEDVTAQVLAK